MANAIYAALSGAMAGEQRLDSVSHNLANVSTPGFQQFRVALEAIQDINKSKQLTFAATAAVERDLTVGPLHKTDNPLDIALAQGVYMSVDNGNGVSYMRGGTLVPRPDGKLVTNEGHLVLGEEDAITVPPETKSITVGVDGTIEADGTPIGKMRLAQFGDEQALVPGPARSLVDPGSAKPVPVTAVQPVVSGYREEANIHVIQGMTEMISTQRNYETLMKTIDTLAAVDKRAARELGRS